MKKRNVMTGRILAITMAAAALFSATALAEGKTIGIATYTMDNSAIYPLIQSMIDSVEAEGDQYVLVSAKGAEDNEGIVQSVEELVARDDIDGILVDNINDTVLTDVVAKAKERNIPMAFNDIPFANPEDVVTNVLNDNFGAGVACAERMVQDLDGKGKVVIWDHRVNAVMRDRTDGVFSVLDQYPDIEVLYEGLCDLDVAKASQNMEDILMTYDEIDAAICLVDNTAIGCLAAMKQQGREGIKLYGVDGSADICPYIKSGEVVMSAGQDFVKMGEETAKALYAYMDGEEVEKEINVDVCVIDSENVDEWIDKFENAEYTF
ncbi:MAG: sugar ABC transporter substrate-binding protein [Eubacteriales bacterium]|nr:sugar ABC transporter substrate-binding protein [Eubacteriales bacterium]